MPLADCLNCGMCETCIDRTIAAHEEHDRLAAWTAERLDALTRNIGRLVNMNNGQCAFAEEVLLEAMALTTDHLFTLDPSHGATPHALTDAERGICSDANRTNERSRVPPGE
jgi:hypothetical protein